MPKENNSMDFYIVIPAHNEEEYLTETLQSLVEQTVLPKQIVVVNDNSTDGTEQIIDGFTNNYSFISKINSTTSTQHLPGSKVINAFNLGYNSLDSNYDVICKFDADLIFPNNYLATIKQHFTNNPLAGMVGGFCYIEKKGVWQLENLTNNDHIRGALKAYRKDCFKAIGGLKPSMGWDTVDELLAQYHNWQIVTNESLQVKHLKPTGHTYNKAAKHKQGEAFYKLRYHFVLTAIASLKLALKKKKPSFFIEYLQGYFKAKKQNLPHLVTKEEGRFIRKLRWSGIFKKLF